MTDGSGAGSTGMQVARRKWFVYTAHDSDHTPEVHGSFNAGYMAGSADLAAAQAEIERLRESQSRIIDGWYDWDRQLRDALATIERQNAVITAARKASTARGQRNWHVANCGGGECDEHYATQFAQLGAEFDLDTALAALDRATTEATTSQNPSGSHGEASSRVPAPNHDHTDVENADGPHRAVADGEA